MRGIATSGHFVGESDERFFLLVRRPQACSSCVLLVPPFAEEANKSRRMMALFGMQLAQRGVASVTLDLACTGDSDGDFKNADWDVWKANISTIWDWASSNDLLVNGILAVRLGAALVNAACNSDDRVRVARTVFWNPVFDGRRHMTQFLRLRAAAGLSAGSARAKSMRQSLSEAGELEVAGYSLSDSLTRQIEQVSPETDFSPSLGQVVWFEVVRDVETAMPVQSLAIIQRFGMSGGVAISERIAGQPFFSTVEIVENDDLIARSVAAFTEIAKG